MTSGFLAKGQLIWILIMAQFPFKEMNFKITQAKRCHEAGRSCQIP